MSAAFAPPLSPESKTSREPATPWRELLLLFLGSRLIIFVTAGLSVLIVNKGAYFSQPKSWLDWFNHWDSTWFLDVAENGYHFARLGGSNNVVFLPLYPLLVRMASVGGLISFKSSGYAVSLGCLWVACVWLWRTVAREWGDPRLAGQAVAFLLFSPVSFFFSSIYSEALFLPLAIGCIASARRQRWWLAGLLGALAAGTRLVGVFLVIPILWEFLVSLRPVPRDRWLSRWPQFVACGLPVAGLAVYFLLMWVRLGDPLMYFRGQSYWGRHFTWWWGTFANNSFAGQPMFYRIWFAAAVLSAFGLLALGPWLRIPTSYLLWALAMEFICVSSRSVEALPRYFSVIFPLYVVLALLTRRQPQLTSPLLALMVALQTLSVILFVNGYWFT